MRRGDTIVNASGGNQHGNQKPQRIDQQMPLAPLDFLASVITPCLTAHLGGLHRLTVDAHRAGSGLAAFLGTNLHSQRIEELGPGAVVSPLGEILVNGAFGKQVVRKHIPLTTGTVKVQDRVDDFSHVDFARSSAVLRTGRRKQRFED